MLVDRALLVFAGKNAFDIKSLATKFTEFFERVFQQGPIICFVCFFKFANGIQV